MTIKETFLIADLTVEITGGETASAICGFDSFRPFKAASWGPVDLVIQTDCLLDREKLHSHTIIHRFVMMGIEHRLSIFDSGYYFEMIDGNGDTIVAVLYQTGSSIVQMSSCHSKETLSFASWFAYCIYAIDRWIVPVHASTLVMNGSAVLFLGESGTGKSTHTRLWLTNFKDSSFLLNDDSPLVRVLDGEVLVYGSPWSGKTSCYVAEHYPLKAAVRLQQSSENKITRLNNLQSIAAVYPSCSPAFAYDHRLKKKMIGIVDRIVRTTAVYSLACLPNVEAAILSKTTIYG